MRTKIGKWEQSDKTKERKNGVLLDTLAQLWKDAEFEQFNAITEVGDNGRLFRRARAKYFTVSMILKLIDCNSPLKKSYWNTYHCVRELTKNHKTNTVTGKYCKNRWCIVCNRIRTAQLINRYRDELTTWKEKQFVTLTIPNVTKDNLAITLNRMEIDFLRIKDLMRKNKQQFVGLRKLECTYNALANTYHPHYHFVIQTKIQGDGLLDEWLRRNPSAKDYAQDVRYANDNDVFELFKYFTKIITTQTGERKIYIHALDVIFQSVAGRRTFQTFGFKAVPQTNEDTERVAEEVAEQSIYEWIHEMYNWIDTDTGEALTDYQPTEQFRELLRNNII